MVTHVCLTPTYMQAQLIDMALYMYELKKLMQLGAYGGLSAAHVVTSLLMPWCCRCSGWQSHLPPAVQ